MSIVNMLLQGYCANCAVKRVAATDGCKYILISAAVVSGKEVNEQ